MDINLLTRCQAGDLDAWDVALRILYPKGLALAKGILRDKELAGDVVQNALVKMYSNLDSIKDLAAFPAWFHRVVTNEAYLALRIYRKETSGEFSVDPSQADPAEQATLRTELINAISRLPLDFQEVVVLCDLLELSMEQAAERCGVPLGTLKSRLFRGRELMRRLLADFRVSKKEKCRVERPIEDLLYDYLEGRLDAVEQTSIEEKLGRDKELQKRLAEQKEFLKLLHSLTGRLSLSAHEVAAKMQEVYGAVEDCSYVEEETVMSNNRPQTITQKVWFKKPNLRRIESEHPNLGSAICIVKAETVIMYYAKQGKATRVQVSDELKNFLGEDFGAILKDVSTNNTTALLGSEVVEGRNCYHLNLRKSAPGGQGQLISHLWLDKLTWMPILTEQYNVDGDLISRKIVRNLVINTGLRDDIFELAPEIDIEDTSVPEIKPPRKLTLEEALLEVDFTPVVPVDPILILNTCTVMEVNGNKVLMLDYHLAGEPLPLVSLTQSRIYHSNIPQGLEVEEVMIGQEAGQYLVMNTMHIKGLVSFQRGELYINLGGNGSREEIIRWAESLKPVDLTVGS